MNGSYELNAIIGSPHLPKVRRSDLYHVVQSPNPLITWLVFIALPDSLRKLLRVYHVSPCKHKLSCGPRYPPLIRKRLQLLGKFQAPGTKVNQMLYYIAVALHKLFNISSKGIQIKLLTCYE